jgi:hypothetical protein
MSRKPRLFLSLSWPIAELRKPPFKWCSIVFSLRHSSSFPFSLCSDSFAPFVAGARSDAEGSVLDGSLSFALRGDCSPGRAGGIKRAARSGWTEPLRGSLRPPTGGRPSVARLLARFRSGNLRGGDSNTTRARCRSARPRALNCSRRSSAGSRELPPGTSGTVKLLLPPRQSRGDSRLG